jgi:hypothetical protein
MYETIHLELMAKDPIMANHIVATTMATTMRRGCPQADFKDLIVITYRGHQR